MDGCKLFPILNAGASRSIYEAIHFQSVANLRLGVSSLSAASTDSPLKPRRTPPTDLSVEFDERRSNRSLWPEFDEYFIRSRGEEGDLEMIRFGQYWHAKNYGVGKIPERPKKEGRNQYTATIKFGGLAMPYSRINELGKVASKCPTPLGPKPT